MNARPRFVWMVVLLSLASLSFWATKSSYRATQKSNSRALSLECSRRLRHLAMDIGAYFQKHGTYPSAALPLSATLKNITRDKTIFCCPTSPDGQDGCYDAFYRVRKRTNGRPTFTLTCFRHQDYLALAGRTRSAISAPAIMSDVKADTSERATRLDILSTHIDRDGYARIRLSAHNPQSRVLVSPYCFENGFTPADIHSRFEPTIQFRGIGRNVYSLARGQVDGVPCYELSVLQGRLHFSLDTFRPYPTTLAAGESALILR